MAADDRLSRAASAVWRIDQDAHMDYEMDGSGDCGEMIARAHNRAKLAAIEEQGFSAESYNAALAERLDSKWLYFSGLEVESEQEFYENHTYVDTGGELSSIAFLLRTEVPA